MLGNSYAVRGESISGLEIFKVTNAISVRCLNITFTKRSYKGDVTRDILCSLIRRSHKLSPAPRDSYRFLENYKKTHEERHYIAWCNYSFYLHYFRYQIFEACYLICCTRGKTFINMLQHT